MVMPNLAVLARAQLETAVSTEIPAAVQHPVPAHRAAPVIEASRAQPVAQIQTRSGTLVRTNQVEMPARRAVQARAGEWALVRDPVEVHDPMVWAVHSPVVPVRAARARAEIPTRAVAGLEAEWDSHNSR